MSSFDVRRFVEGLKNAGVVIGNESDLVARVSASQDPKRELSRHFKQARILRVSFSVDPRRSAGDLVQVFKDNDLDDGWTYQEFLGCAKLIGE